MSLMCKLGSKCGTAKGMCIHEKMMMVMVVIGMAAAGHYVFNWF